MICLSKLKLAALVAIASLTLGIASYNLGYQSGILEGEIRGQRKMASAYDKFAVQTLKANNDCLNLTKQVIAENIVLRIELSERQLEDETVRFIKE